MKNKEIEKDSRLSGQEKYLKNVKLKWTKLAYEPQWEHDHCVFCWEKFYEGFATEDNMHYVCKKCFRDFRESFKWKVL